MKEKSEKKVKAKEFYFYVKGDVEQDFSAFFEIIKNSESLRCSLTPYWNVFKGSEEPDPWDPLWGSYVGKEDKYRRLMETLKDQIKRLKPIFESIDLTVLRNAERYALYKFILKYYDDYPGVREAAGLPVEDPYYCSDVKVNHMDVISKIIIKMKKFQDAVALSEGVELVSMLLHYRTDEDPFPNFRLDLAEMAAYLGERKNAYNLVFLAFNREGECKEYDEQITIRQIFFEESAFARELQAKRHGNPRICFLTEYPYLRDLYQNDPFKFYKRWHNKDKLQAIFDVIQLISFPFNERDREFFDQFCQLIKPVCEACLELEGLEKYFELAEIFIKNGKEQAGFDLYKIICQELKNELLKCRISPYREYWEGEQVDWNRYGYLHADLDKRLSQVLKGIPIDAESVLLMEILKFFLEEPPDFDPDYKAVYVSLFKAIITSHPEKVNRFISQLREWNSLTTRLFMIIPLEIMERELNDLLKNTTNKLDDEWFWDEYPFFWALLDRECHLELVKFKNVFCKIIKLECILEQLRYTWGVESDEMIKFKSDLASLLKLMAQIDEERKSSIFKQSIQALQRWRDKIMQNKYERVESRQLFKEFNAILHKIRRIYCTEFIPSPT